MCGDLKNAIGGRVDDGLPGSHMFIAKLLNDFGSRHWAVAKHSPTDPRFELSHEFRWETMWVNRERLLEMYSRHLPVTRGSVLAGRGERASSIRGGRAQRGFNVHYRADISQPPPRKIRQAQGTLLCDIT